jgi:cytosine/adenosine deaminase-related metal-dependent hydrolase
MITRLTALFALALVATDGAAQTTPRAPRHGERSPRLAIRNALIVEGNGTPASGPFDIVLEGNTIAQIVALDPVAVREGRARRPQADVEIDASGKYVLPGLINLHGHVQEERGGVPQPLDYELKLWLASGITAVRDVGSRTRRTLELRERSAAGTLESPRLLVYASFGGGGDDVESRSIRTPEEARARVRALKAMGVDGIKSVGIDRDLMQAMLEEAKKVGLPVAHHTGVEETNAWDDARFGTTSIEHWYGVPDAALREGVQGFPSTYNYNDEVDRFRYAGRLWREADPERLGKVLQALVDAGVAWNPTLVIYEASRDLLRAQHQPWFKDYLHPTLE